VRAWKAGPAAGLPLSDLFAAAIRETLASARV
jgi:hypothetical protein